MRLRILVLVATCAIALGVASCKKAAPNPAQPSGGGGGNTTTASITIPRGDGYSASSFAPGSLTIAPGTTVTWGNQDSQPHTVTSNTNIWTDSVAAGGTASHKFDTRGSFDYKCTLHAGMTGTITVQ